MWLTHVYMSGEQITNTSVETQIIEDDHHSLESSPPKTVLEHKTVLSEGEETQESE